MELALFCPVYGFYEKEEDTIGAAGHFYTSVSTGKLFGEILGYRFADWLSELSCVQSQNSKVQIVEAGAHRGELARDLLLWSQRYWAELFERLHYWIVEPSEKRRAWQKQTLQGVSNKVFWAESFQELRQKCGAVRGVIFSNELLDAMPVHRIGWDAGKGAWFEWGVAFEGGQFIWKRLPKIECEIEPLLKLPAGLLSVLPDGFTFEMSPAAELWWREAAQSLAEGKLMTIDYGLSEEELLMPERRNGTLRGYYRHKATTNVLAEPGEQDLTAHVNFSRIQSIGEAAGLKTELFVSQAQFLTSIAAQIWEKPSTFGEWNAEYSRQFQTLTHPEHLGRSFRVLVQRRQDF